MTPTDTEALNDAGRRQQGSGLEMLGSLKAKPGNSNLNALDVQSAGVPHFITLGEAARRVVARQAANDGAQ